MEPNTLSPVVSAPSFESVPPPRNWPLSTPKVVSVAPVCVKGGPPEVAEPPTTRSVPVPLMAWARTIPPPEGASSRIPSFTTGPGMEPASILTVPARMVVVPPWMDPKPGTMIESRPAPDLVSPPGPDVPPWTRRSAALEKRERRREHQRVLDEGRGGARVELRRSTVEGERGPREGEADAADDVHPVDRPRGIGDRVDRRAGRAEGDEGRVRARRRDAADPVAGGAPLAVDAAGAAPVHGPGGGSQADGQDGEEPFRVDGESAAVHRVRGGRVVGAYRDERISPADRATRPGPAPEKNRGARRRPKVLPHYPGTAAEHRHPTHRPRSRRTSSRAG